MIGLQTRWAFVLLPALAVGCGDETPRGGGADAARAYRPLRDMATYTSPEDAQAPDVGRRSPRGTSPLESGCAVIYCAPPFRTTG